MINVLQLDHVCSLQLGAWSDSPFFSESTMKEHVLTRLTLTWKEDAARVCEWPLVSVVTPVREENEVLVVLSC